MTAATGDKALPGLVKSFVKDHREWDHQSFTEFAAGAREVSSAAKSMSDEDIGNLLEAEKAKQLSKPKKVRRKK